MSEFSGKNKKDLENLLHEKRQALRTFRFGVSGSKVRNIKEGRNLQKDIARIMTELSALKAK